MAGRNNRPRPDGKTAEPSRLDQFGDKLASDTAEEAGRANAGPKGPAGGGNACP